MATPYRSVGVYWPPSRSALYLAEHAYACGTLALPMNKPAPIEVVPYDPIWPVEFDELAMVIARALGDAALRIEHVGSTSVPGLAAKPIIDIDVVIADIQGLPPAIARLATLGYVHQGNLGVPGREAFKYADASVPHDGSDRAWMTHHLYVCVQDSPELRRHVGFRDYLRSHPEVADAYGRLKVELAEKYRNDRLEYNNAKTEFVRGVYRAAGLKLD
jgi:GrpB-like predicted nucleotidyltransferase (UPF0157 family)